MSSKPRYPLTLEIVSISTHFQLHHTNLSIKLSFGSWVFVAESAGIASLMGWADRPLRISGSAISKQLTFKRPLSPRQYREEDAGMKREERRQKKQKIKIKSIPIASDHPVQVLTADCISASACREVRTPPETLDQPYNWLRLARRRHQLRQRLQVDQILSVIQFSGIYL